jgi:hypothetical protein
MLLPRLHSVAAPADRKFNMPEGVAVLLIIAKD